MNDQVNFTRSEITGGAIILFYGIIWTLIFLVLFVFPVDFTHIARYLSVPFSYDDYFVVHSIWLFCVSAGLGGTISLFHSLYTATVQGQSRLDFSGVVSYLAYPIIGMVIGIISGAVILLVIDAVTRFFDSEFELDSSLFFWLLLVGYVVGYQQRAIFKVVGRFFRFFKPEISQA